MSRALERNAFVEVVMLASLCAVSRAQMPRQHLTFSYAKLDTQLFWPLGGSLKLAFVGQNLIRDHHEEFSGSLQVVNATQVKRGAYAQLKWRF